MTDWAKIKKQYLQQLEAGRLQPSTAPLVIGEKVPPTLYQTLAQKIKPSQSTTPQDTTTTSVLDEDTVTTSEYQSGLQSEYAKGGEAESTYKKMEMYPSRYFTRIDAPPSGYRLESPYQNYIGSYVVPMSWVTGDPSAQGNRIMSESELKSLIREKRMGVRSSRVDIYKMIQESQTLPEYGVLSKTAKGGYTVSVDYDRWYKDFASKQSGVQQSVSRGLATFLGGFASPDYILASLRGDTKAMDRTITRWQYDVDTMFKKGDIAGIYLSPPSMTNVVLPMAVGVGFGLASRGVSYGVSTLAGKGLTTSAKILSGGFTVAKYGVGVVAVGGAGVDVGSSLLSKQYEDASKKFIRYGTMFMSFGLGASLVKPVSIPKVGEIRSPSKPQDFTFRQYLSRGVYRAKSMIPESLRIEPKWERFRFRQGYFEKELSLPYKNYVSGVFRRPESIGFMPSGIETTTVGLSPNVFLTYASDKSFISLTKTYLQPTGVYRTRTLSAYKTYEGDWDLTPSIVRSTTTGLVKTSEAPRLSMGDYIVSKTEGSFKTSDVFKVLDKRYDEILGFGNRLFNEDVYVKAVSISKQTGGDVGVPGKYGFATVKQPTYELSFTKGFTPSGFFSDIGVVKVPSFGSGVLDVGVKYTSVKPGFSMPGGMGVETGGVKFPTLNRFGLYPGVAKMDYSLDLPLVGSSYWKDVMPSQSTVVKGISKIQVPTLNTASILDQLQQSSQRQNLSKASISSQLSNTASLTASILSSVSMQQQQLQQQQQQIQVLSQIPLSNFTRVIRPISLTDVVPSTSTTFRTPSLFMNLRSRTESKPGQGYKVLIKERQYYHGKPKGKASFKTMPIHSLSYSDAHSLGMYLTDMSVGMSYKLKPVGGKPKPLSLNLPVGLEYKFYKRGGSHIEKRSYAIDTPSEVKQLSSFSVLRTLRKKSFKRPSISMPKEIKVKSVMPDLDKIIDVDKLIFGKRKRRRFGI